MLNYFVSSEALEWSVIAPAPTPAFHRVPGSSKRSRGSIGACTPGTRVARWRVRTVHPARRRDAFLRIGASPRAPSHPGSRLTVNAAPGPDGQAVQLRSVVRLFQAVDQWAAGDRELADVLTNARVGSDQLHRHVEARALRSRPHSTERAEGCILSPPTVPRDAHCASG